MGRLRDKQQFGYTSVPITLEFQIGKFCIPNTTALVFLMTGRLQLPNTTEVSSFQSVGLS